MIVLDAMEYATDEAALAAWVASYPVSLSGGTPSADTEYDASYTADKAFDGDNGTRWNTTNTPYPHWWKYDFGAGNEKILTEIIVQQLSGVGEVHLKEITIEGSNDDSVYTPLYTGTGSATETTQTFTLANLTAYRYLKITCTNNWEGNNWLNIVEIQCFSIYPSLCFSESTIKQKGSYSLKIVAQQTISLNKTITRTLSPTFNLSGQTEFKFPVRSSRTGSNFKIGIHDSGGTTTEVTPNIAVVDTWQEVTLDLSGISDSDKNSIDSIIYTQLNADAETTVYLDWMRALSDGEYTAEDIAAAEAAQLATDQAAVLAKAGSIKDDETILGQAGTYDFTAAIAAGHASGHAAQLVTDTAEVESHKASIEKDVVILGVTGTFEGSGSGDYSDPANVLDSDTTDGVPGTYKEVAEAYVLAGVTYGASSGKTGTYAPTSSTGDGTITGDALRDIYNSPLGIDAVYTPLTGDPVPLRIMLNKNIVLQPSSMDTQVVELGTTIEAILADLGKLPVRGETFVADSDVYTVQSISRNDGEEVEVIVT